MVAVSLKKKEQMDPLDLKVKMVIEDQLVLTDPKEKSETQVVLDLLVCKDFAVFQAELDLPASLVALENVVYLVLMARTENRDPKVSKVFPDLLVFPENAVLWERTVKTEILDRQELPDLAVIQAKTELLVPKALLVLLALMVNAVPLFFFKQKTAYELLA